MSSDFVGQRIEGVRDQSSERALQYAGGELKQALEECTLSDR